MKLRSLAVSAAALAIAATGAVAGLGASAASAAPQAHVLTATSVQTSAVRVSPHVEILRFRDFTPQLAAPGFTNSSNIVAVCFSLPRVTVCDWRLTSTANRANTLFGSVVETPGGAAGRVLGGTGTGAGATGTARVVNIAPNTSTDTFSYTTPVVEPLV